MKQRLLASAPIELIADVGAYDAEAFFKIVLPESFSKPFSVFHEYLLHVVQERQLTGRRLVTAGPRGWGKSTTITEGGPIWIACRNEYIEFNKRYKFILIISDTQSQAEDRLNTIKSVLSENEAIEKYYPHAFGVGVKWSKSEIVTKNDIAIYARGMTSSIRGIRYKNRRPDLIMLDDPDSLETVYSPTVNRTLEETFTRDILKCGHKNTDILVVGSVLAKAALVYKLLHEDRFAGWSGQIFKALEHFPENMDLWDTYALLLKNRRDPNARKNATQYFEENKEEMLKGGLSNWPLVYSVKDLMDEFYLEGRKSFMMEKQNEIMETEDAYFKLEEYRYYEDIEEVMQYNPLIYVYVDPTGGLKKSKGISRRKGDSDRFAATVLAKVNDKLLYVIDGVYGTFKASQQFHLVKKLLDKWDVYRISIEDRGDEFYINQFRDYLLKNNYRKRVPRRVTHSIPKEYRINALEPHLQTHKLILPSTTNLVRSKLRFLFDELDDFPHSEYDDCLDSLSGAFFSAYKTHKLAYLHKD